MEPQCTEQDDFMAKITIIFFIVMILLLSVCLWWQTMRTNDEIQMLRAMSERNNELILDIRQEIAAQADRDEKRTKQIIEQVHRAVNGEAW